MNVLRPSVAMVLGGASTVWDDVLTLEAEYGKAWDGLVVCVNDVGAHWPRELQHWASLHANKFPKWQALRRELGMPECAPVTWGQPQRFINAPVEVDVVQVPWAGGSSGMFGVQVAVEALECTRVVICGMPMTDSPHFADSREEHGTRWGRANNHWRPWPRLAERLRPVVRSMSGRTMELLGAPTRAWLESSVPQDRLTLVNGDDAASGDDDASQGVLA